MYFEKGRKNLKQDLLSLDQQLFENIIFKKGEE
jgi:hypothetical protein